MAVLLVTYDLKETAKNYAELLQAIKASKNWAKLGGSSYLVETGETPVELRNRLAKALVAGDKLWVGSAPAPSAWYGLSDTVSDWILNHQKQK